MSQPDDHPLGELIAGYPKLAGQMGLLPEAAIFRTFSALNARNLLYLQAELTTLEKELILCEKQDSKDVAKKYAIDWFWLEQSKFEPESAKQHDLVLQMRMKLKEYSVFSSRRKRSR